MAKKSKEVEVTEEPTVEPTEQVEEISPVDAAFKAAIDAGKDKNEVILDLAAVLNNNITLAVREYTRLVRENGLVLAPKERTEKIDVLLATKHDSILDSTTRSELAQEIADEFDISLATANQHIRDYAARNSLELPSVQRTSLEDLIKFVQADRETGAERADTIKKLEQEFGYTPNSATSAYSRVLKELGIAGGRNGPKVAISDLVAHIRANSSKGKKEAIKIVAAATGYSESTTTAYFQYLPFAEEWHRQESEATAQ